MSPTPRHGRQPSPSETRPESHPEAQAETPPAAQADADRRGLVSRAQRAIDRLSAEPRKLLLWNCGLGALAVLAMGVLGLYVLSIGSQFSDEAVAARTVAAADEVRGFPGQSCDDPVQPSYYTLECANRERAAAGLEPVEAPPGLSAAQIGGVVGEARSDLRAVLRERAERTTPDSGVSSPPTTGRFRGPR